MTTSWRKRPEVRSAPERPSPASAALPFFYPCPTSAAPCPSPSISGPSSTPGPSTSATPTAPSTSVATPVGHQ